MRTPPQVLSARAWTLDLAGRGGDPFRDNLAHERIAVARCNNIHQITRAAFLVLGSQLSSPSKRNSVREPVTLKVPFDTVSHLQR
jgi:hypothetical protein